MDVCVSSSATGWLVWFEVVGNRLVDDTNSDFDFNVVSPLSRGFANFEIVDDRLYPFGFGIRVEPLSKRGIFVIFCS